MKYPSYTLISNLFVSWNRNIFNIVDCENAGALEQKLNLAEILEGSSPIPYSEDCFWWRILESDMDSTVWSLWLMRKAIRHRVYFNYYDCKSP